MRNLSDKINHLRLHASFLFDVGKSQGMKSEEIAKTIIPLSNELSNQILTSSVGDKIFAIKALEGQIEGHYLTRHGIEQKIEECQDYIERIKATFTENLHHDGYSVTIVNGEVNIK